MRLYLPGHRHIDGHCSLDAAGRFHHFFETFLRPPEVQAAHGYLAARPLDAGETHRDLVKTIPTPPKTPSRFREMFGDDGRQLV